MSARRRNIEPPAIHAVPEPGADSGLSWPVLALIVTVILGGGALGVTANRWMNERPAELDSMGSGTEESPEVAVTVSEQQPGRPPATRIGPFSLRLASSTPPANPFAIPAAAVGAASWPAVPTLPGIPAITPGTGAAGTPTPSVAASNPAANVEKKVSAAEILLTGVIQGEPPLAVVRFRGQSHFLKIGDRIADSWRLEAINERSAVIRQGDQRVIIPIQGGNSQ